MASEGNLEGFCKTGRTPGGHQMDFTMKWLTLLHGPDDIVEIRSIDPKPIISGYFKASSPAIATELAKYPNRTFYQTLNVVQPACYARVQHERLIEHPRETTVSSWHLRQHRHLCHLFD